MPQAAAPPRPRLVCNRSELSGGGTASMPVREKGRRRPGSPPARPFSRPQPPADRRQSAGFSPMASGFTAETDWLLEEDGFEPVWGFSCQVVIFGFWQFFVRSGKAVLH